MSHSTPNTSLSLSARLFLFLGAPSTILFTSIASPRTGLLSPVAFIPTAYFFRKWRDSNNVNTSRRGELEPMVWTYAATGTVGVAAVATIQLLAARGVTTLLFGAGEARKDFIKEFLRNTIDGLTADELASRAALAASWQNWVFNGLFTFGMAGLLEETLKYLPIAYARRRGTPEQRRPRNRAYLDYALSGALSFGVLETIGFLYVICERGEPSWPKTLLTLFERVVLGATGHLLVAALTALRAIRRDYYGEPLSWWGVVAPAVLLHGIFDFGALAFSASEGNVGWIHPTGVGRTVMMLGLGVGIQGFAASLVRREWKWLEDQDRRVE